MLTKAGVVIDDAKNQVIIATGYDHNDLAGLRVEQSNDNIYLLHQKYTTKKLCRYSHTNWRLVDANYGASLAAPANLWISNQGTGDTTEPSWDMLVIAVDENGKYSDRSSVLKVFQSQTLAWSAVSGAEYYRVYKAENNAFGWVCNTPGTTYKDPDQESGTVPDMKSTAPVKKLPFEGAGNYPGYAESFKSRMIYTNSYNKPSTLFGSKTGDFENMNISNPSGDDDAFTWKVLTGKMNKIVWICEYGDDLIIGTEGGIRKHSCGGEALTPDNPNIVGVKTKGGCADIHPLDVGDSILYIQHGNPHVRDFVYSLEIDGYRGDDLSLFAYHLVDNHKIVDWCYQRDPDGIVWLVRDDGVLLGLTYAKEHQVYGWHEHTTDGRILSCACIADGDQDNEVYFVVERIIEGVSRKYIEKLSRRNDTDPVEAFFADSYVTYRGVATTGVSDLEHLEGKEVVILAGGHVVRNRVVKNGKIELEFPEEVIHIGLPYVSRVETMNLIAQLNNGVSLGVKQTVREVSVLFENSWRCYIGYSRQ